MRLSAVIGILFLFMVSACDRAEPEIVLAPANFKGGILVLFNQKSGKPTRYHDGKRLYEIPPDGILKTQFSQNLGWIDFVEFYRGSISARNRLPSYVILDKAPNNLIVGYMGPSGTQRKETVDEDWYHYTEFYIGTKSDIDTLYMPKRIIDISQIAK